MNEKKYEITNIAHPHYPWLHRIRALRDVREDVHAGDLGGFVQSEENLSQEGQCWIAGNAVVAEEAYVYGDAILWDHACARGCAAISGPMWITSLVGLSMVTPGKITAVSRTSISPPSSP